MNYAFIIGNDTIISGDVLIAGIVAGSILVLIVAGIFATIRRLRSNEKLKYEFVTIIAHKFRTPLTHIKWSAENLAESETDGYRRQSISDIKGSNEKLIKLTGSLLELTDSDESAASSYKFERLELCALTKAAVDASIKAFHEKNLFISFDCAAGSAMIRGDKARLEFVLNTLLENACMYTQTGRNIAVTVTATHGKAIVSVSDAGIGIDEKDIPRLFTKFFRGDNARQMETEGVGIGLYLAQSVVQRHHGKIKVYSPGLGQGSTFSLILPRIK